MKKKMAFILASVMLFSGSCVNVHAADNDGWTEAALTDAAQNGEWEKWCEKWESEKNNLENVSLTPGKTEKEVNLAWYSKTESGVPAFRFYTDDAVSASSVEVYFESEKGYSENIHLAEGDLVVDVEQTLAIKGYNSNKAVVKNLKANTTYYYSYEVDGQWSEPKAYTSQNVNSGYSFAFFGDPQIGSSSSNTPTGATEKQGQELAVRNDSFNWNYTVERAYELNPDMSFMLSAGDQIQTRDKKATADSALTYKKNEIEYTGYLMPERLKSLPVATTIGNHDALSTNYTYHFNNPNASELGSTFAGGDYYFSYGNTLFIMLNTNNKNIAEHKRVIEEAVASDSDATWRVVTLHQDIYGSGEHSNEPAIVELRYGLAPIFEANKIDVVLTGHDHTYSRSFMLKGGYQESLSLDDDTFDEYIDGERPIDSAYNDYLTSIEDAGAVCSGDVQRVVNPEGILYLTANSASGSKYYDLVEHKQAYIAARWQEDVPTFSMIEVTDKEFIVNTYRTDNMEKIDTEFVIEKNDGTVESTETTTEKATETTTKTVSYSRSGGGSSSKKASSKAVETTTEITTINTESETGSGTPVSLTIGSNSIFVGENEYTLEAAPFIDNGSTLIPLRAAAVAILGGDVDKADSSSLISWNGINKTATISYMGSSAVFTADSNTVIVNGMSIPMENGAIAKIEKGRMYIPIRALAKALGKDVIWDEVNKTVIYK